MTVKITKRKDRPGKLRVQLICDDPGRTEQAHKDACDINNIMLRAKPQPTNGIIANPGMYGDVSEVGSFQEALDKIHATQQEFQALSAQIRARFDNNPANLIAYLEDPENHAEAVKLGIIQAPEGYVPPSVADSVPASTPVTADNPPNPDAKDS